MQLTTNAANLAILFCAFYKSALLHPKRPRISLLIQNNCEDGIRSSAPASVGKTLFVEVTKYANDQHDEFFVVDNVSLSANSVSEPSSSALLDHGGLGLTLRPRR